jgi:hypothetical protein
MTSPRERIELVSQGPAVVLNFDTTASLRRHYIGHFIMFSVITDIYNKKTKGSTFMELSTATGKLKTFFFYHLRYSMCAPRVTWHTVIRHSSSCHTRVNMGASIFFTAFRHGSLQHWRISMQPCWRVCGKNLSIVSMCTVSTVVHTWNISSWKKKSVFLWLWTIPLR